MNHRRMDSLRIFAAAAWMATTGVIMAQDDIPLLLPEEKEAVEAQSVEFNQALEPALAEAAKSTVRVWAGKRRLCYGTVIGDGREVLAKWSEVARFKDALLVQGPGNETRKARVAKVHEDDDLAMIGVEGAPLTPVKWSAGQAELGRLIAAPQPDGRPAGHGVVGVLERNLRERDQAFLGIEGDMDFDGPGVRIRRVTEDSGAAAAGLKRGDVILKVGDRAISGLLELKNSLVGIAPGDRVRILAKTGGREKTCEVVLGNRPDLPSFPGGRLMAMERMSGPLSLVSQIYARVIQSDMRLKPDQIGGPVVNLNGEVIGISVARASRTHSFVMPADAVREVLAKPAADPAIAKVRLPENPVGQRAARGMRPGRPAPSGERMRQHLSEMQRLMDFMREEMEALERGER